MFKVSSYTPRMSVSFCSHSPLVGAKIRYGQPERWKSVAKKHGRTKLTRRPHGERKKTSPRNVFQYKNDGRPPDRAKDLFKTGVKKRKSQLRFQAKVRVNPPSSGESRQALPTYSLVDIMHRS